MIDRLLANRALTSAQFQEWRRAYEELFPGDTPSSDAPDQSQPGDEPTPPLTPSLSHTHSYIETHV